MNNDDEDDDNYPGKLLHQAALYLNVDLLKVRFKSHSKINHALFIGSFNR